jgi:protease I
MTTSHKTSADIDQTIEDSFPASDPPSWTLGSEDRSDNVSEDLKGKTIAILATDGFEQSELLEPRRALEEAGAHTEVISPHGGNIKAWNMKDWGEEIPVDVEINAADPQRYDGLLLPGGTMSPDKLRQEPRAVEFVKSFFEQHKPVAAICHGPWMLVEAGVIKGKRLTSWPSLRTDIRNAGGEWVDEQVVEDDLLVTSRKPQDLEAFNRKILEMFSHETSAEMAAENGQVTGTP